jgi:amidohydrolase
MACNFIESHGDEIVSLSLAVHEAKELGLQEFKSSQYLADFLKRHNLQVETGIAGLPTAFRAAAAGYTAKPLIALLAEYDALPGVGHGCGHNIIGASAAAAGAALAALGADLPGSVWVLGTPAEETAGGKIPIAQAGCFENVAAVLMEHPISGESRMGGTSLATHSFRITYHGKPAHAAASPQAGVNALDAACIFLHAVGLLRQHVTEDVRMHGIIAKGGEAPNIIPDHVEVGYLARAAKRSTLDGVAAKVKGCIEAGALATGCSFDLIERRGYDPVKPNRVMDEVLRSAFAAAGIDIGADPLNLRGSTDLGQVSQLVPQACAYPSIAPDSVAGHSSELAAAAASPEGHRVLLASAKALAMAALDLMAKPELLEAAWKEFRGNE